MKIDANAKPCSFGRGACTRRQPRPSSRRAGVAVAIACGLLIGRADANEVSRFETLGCNDFACADTFELKCTQAASMLCITIETGSVTPPSTPTFVASAVATAPSTMLGAAKVIQLFADADRSLCLPRPGAPGTLKALLTVAVNGGGPSPVPYTARAQCYAGNLFDGLTSKKTTLALEQDQ